MKINGFAILSLFSLVTGSVARPGNRFRSRDETDPLDQKSRVTAFVNTDDGLKVECWEIGDLLPQSQITRADGSKGTVHRKNMASLIGGITLFSFAPSVTIFSFGATGVHNNAVDFRSRPNLFTVKDGLIFIEAYPINGDAAARAKGEEQFVFADVNGDDWFYFEDTTSGDDDDDSYEQCANPKAASTFNVRTISGSETTLINFEYESTPSHTVLHEGRCNFAGLKPVDESSQSDRDSGRFRFRSQDS